ncbi:MAG: FKBP-type peptidyl-prolyl cis-trans isomerase [Verrucomicrobiota bacterium]
MIIRIVFTLAVASVLAGCSKETASAPGPDAAPKAATNTASNPVPVTLVQPDATSMTATASGLKYVVLKHGSGTISPKATDTVKVHYHGTLLDGTVFDSSVERGEPISFALNQVIPGWTEGLQLMKVGDKFKFEIPANLAYGPNSPSPKIPANSTLVFEVELLAIQ